MLAALVSKLNVHVPAGMSVRFAVVPLPPPSTIQPFVFVPATGAGGLVAVYALLRAFGVNCCQFVPVLFVPSVTPGQFVPAVQALAGFAASIVSVVAPVNVPEAVLER